VAVDQELGLDLDHIAERSLDRGATAIDARPDARDHHAAAAVELVSACAPHRTTLAPPAMEPQPIVRAALARLGVERMVVVIHQASFPAGDDDLAHGTPYSGCAASLIERIAALGFTGIMFGPAGVTSEPDASPYDGTALSRDPLHIAFGALEPPFDALFDRDALAAAFAAAAGDGERCRHREAWRAVRGLLAGAVDVLRRDAGAHAEVRRALAAERAERPWLVDEARFEAIASAVGHDDWTRWPASPPLDERGALGFELGQAIVRRQHARLVARMRTLGLRLYGDLAIGLGHRDRWGREALFLPGYAMGAPPSRTNPAGQPWGYPVLSPDALGHGGAARAFVEQRLAALFDEHDGVRIDHPHGWVCPWVYRTDLGDDPATAVRAGARLYESPDLPDHPALARHAVVTPAQLDRARPRHDDGWVTRLEPAQIDRYAELVDRMVAIAAAHGRDRGDLVIEVLSTCPAPLAAVLARHQLGRYRVTQKSDPSDRADVYRSDRAAPADWIMFGNHDTPPLAAVLDRWQTAGLVGPRAAYLAERLAPDAAARPALAATLARDRGALATAALADLFVGPARNVQIFWPDLVGLRERYNQPGVISDDNWALRLPRDLDAALAAAVARGDAPDLGAALAMALAARGLDRDPDGAALAARLRERPSARSVRSDRGGHRAASRR
jgi:4-alpha-glucanotransferase